LGCGRIDSEWLGKSSKVPGSLYRIFDCVWKITFFKKHDILKVRDNFWITGLFDFLIFLPIAGIKISPVFPLLTGMLGGVLSGMLGIGGGLVIVPTLIILGIPSNLVMISQMNNAVAGELVSFLEYWRRKDVDFGLSGYVLIGGIIGISIEFVVLRWLKSSFQNIAAIRITIAILISFLGILMLVQNIQALKKIPVSQPRESGASMRHWMIYFPFHRIFIRSRVEMSVLVPAGVGLLTGFLTSTLGGATNVFIAPILTYLIGRVSSSVMGTALLAGMGIKFLIIVISSFQGMCADFVLTSLLIIGGAIGIFIGTRISYRVRRPYLGILGSGVIFIICIKMWSSLYLSDWRSVPDLSIKAHDLNDVIQSVQVSRYDYWVKSILQFAQENRFEYTVMVLILFIILSLLLNNLVAKKLLGWL
jgi:uncharacterized membrane protein YfcA